MLNNASKKFLLGFLGIIGIAILVLVGVVYLNPEARQERAALKYFEELEKEYRNDTYGGATPEETLALFIEALEAGDIELASKYFLSDDREEIKSYLIRAREESGDFSRFANDLEALKLSKKEDDRAFYTIADENNVVEVQVILKRNQNGIWKITEL